MNKNKAFSLVELIVVVAIMAVLVGILAPAYLSYVEKTRRGTDEDAVEEIRHAVEVAVADICVYEECRSGATLSYSDNTGIANAATAASKPELAKALTDVFADKALDLKSKKYGNSTYTVTVSDNVGAGTDAALTVTGSWSAAAGD